MVGLTFFIGDSLLEGLILVMFVDSKHISRLPPPIVSYDAKVGQQQHPRAAQDKTNTKKIYLKIQQLGNILCL